MKKIYRGIFICMLAVFSLSLVACGEKADENVTVSSNTDAETIDTEQEIREEISSLGTDEESLKLKIDYYNKLWQIDAFLKEDFDGLSDVYEALGDKEMVRETLIRKHTYYPEEENLEAISDIVVEGNTTSEAMISIMNELNTYIVDYSADNVRVLIESVEWQECMQDELVGVKRKTRYDGEGYLAQISSDKYSTEIFILNADNTMNYYEYSEAGIIWGTATYCDNAYNGEYSLNYYDYAGNFIKEIKGTFSNNVSIGDFQMIYDGITYEGAFDENGKTTVEQSEDIEEIGGVIYAYGDSGRKYLYIENSTVDTFMIDNVYLGVDMFVPW